MPRVIRFRVREQPNAFTDGVFGTYEENLLEQEGDFILLKSDG